MYKGPGAGTTDTFTPDNLLGGDFPLVSDDETIATGQNLTRGAVLGKITASGALVLSVAAAADGSEEPYGVLVQDTDATDAAVTAPVYKTGIFNERALTLGAGHTVASIKDGLRALGIFIKKTVAAG